MKKIMLPIFLFFITLSLSFSPSVYAQSTAPGSCGKTITGKPFCCAQNPVDDDGDGWGYEGGKSCVIKGNLVCGKTILADKYFCCDENASDGSISDGWGYEGGKSCVIKGNLVCGASPSGNKYCCSSGAINNDDDGNGWDYEAPNACLIKYGVADGQTGDSSAGQTGDSSATSTVDDFSKLVNPLAAGNVNDIPTLVQRILEIVLKIGTPIIALAIIYAGYLFIAAQGDPTKLKTAKDTLVYVVIGAAILLGAYVIAESIVGTVNAIRGQ